MKDENIKRTRSNRYKEENIKKEIPIKKETNNTKKNEHPKIKKIFFYLLIPIIVFITYSCFIETKLFTTKEYKTESSLLPESFHGIKIVHFSDIHYGTSINKKELKRIVKNINSLKPDIILFTGDLIDKNITITENIKKELINTLKDLDCTIGKFAIYGDEDLENDFFESIITDSSFKLLKDESTLLYYLDNIPIEITGYNPIITKPNYTILTNMVDEQDTTNYFKIVLTHEPDSIDKFINYNPNIIASGHNLGGIIKIPFLKPLFIQKNSKKYYKDYYKIKNSNLFISNGLGTSNINIRFNNFPSVNLYRLYKTN